MNNTIQSIDKWFLTAKPNYTNQNLVTQLAIHLEEISEMFDSINFEVASEFMRKLKEETLKVVEEGEEACSNMVANWNKVELLDSLCDQIVTATGVATYSGFDIVGAIEEVSKSNNSKFDENGKPILNEYGKIIKGPNYFKPELEQFINKGCNCEL